MKYVVGFLFTEDRKQVVLIQKNKPEWQAGKFNGVGGKLEPGEVWSDGMAREFFEETGVRISAWDWEHTVTLYNDDFECRFFRAFSDLAKVAKTTEEEEVVVYHLVGLGHVPVISNLRWLLPLQLDDGLHFPIRIKDGKPTG